LILRSIDLIFGKDPPGLRTAIQRRIDGWPD
jgi:hypothetical protein